MKERGMIFGDFSVPAILDGRKTQTRRVVKPMRGIQSQWLKPRMINKVDKMCLGYTNPERHFGVQMEHPLGGPLGWIRSPYGVVGDHLWVREAFAYRCADPQSDPEYSVMYRANGMCVVEPRWKPSIHMPRWASRINLEITGVRVERLQEISEEDAVAEGAPFVCELCGNDVNTVEGNEIHWACDDYDDEYVSCREGFRRSWGSINAKRGYPWESNPWVWVYEFKVVTDAH